MLGGTGFCEHGLEADATSKHGLEAHAMDLFEQIQDTIFLFILGFVQ